MKRKMIGVLALLFLVCPLAGMERNAKPVPRPNRPFSVNKRNPFDTPQMYAQAQIPQPYPKGGAFVAAPARRTEEPDPGEQPKPAGFKPSPRAIKPAQSPVPDSSVQGQVTLPLSEYERVMLQANSGEDSGEGIAAGLTLISSADYSGKVEEKNLNLRVNIKGRVYKKGLNKIYLFKVTDGFNISEFRSIKESTELISDEQGYYLMVNSNKVGSEYEAGYVLDVPLDDQDKAMQAIIPSPAAMFSSFNVETGPGLKPRVSPALKTRVDQLEAGWSLQASLPKCDEIILTLAPEEPSGNYNFTNASYRGEVNGQSALFEVNAELITEQFNTRVPLAGLDLALSQVLVDGKTTAVKIEDGRFVLAGLAPGRHKLLLKFYLQVLESREGSSVLAPVFPAAVTSMEFIIPGASVQADASPSFGQKLAVQGGKTYLRTQLPLTSQVRISWGEKSMEKLMLASGQKQPLRLYAETFSRVYLEDGLLRVSQEIDFRVARGDVSRLVFNLPKGVEVISMEGKYIKSWNNRDDKQGRICEVYLDRKVKEQYQLLVVYEKLLEGLPLKLDYPRLKMQEVEREKGVIVVMRNDALRVQPAQVQGLRPVELDNLGPGEEPLFIYKYLKPDYNLELDLAEPAEQNAEVSANLWGLISIGEGIMNVRTQIDYLVQRAGTSSFLVELPPEVNLTGVQGKYIRGQEIVPLKDRKQLKVTLTKPVHGKWSLFLNYEKLIDRKAGQIDFPFAELPGIKSAEASFGVEALANMEVKIAQSENIKQLDLSRIPEAIKDQAQSLILLGFSYSSMEEVSKKRLLKLSINKYEDVAVKDAIIDEAHFMTLCLENGFCITKAVFSVRNKSKQYLELTLPKSSELWSTFLVGDAVRPSRNSEGNYLVPLTRSESAMSGMENFPVEVVYADHVKKWGSTGKLALAMPKLNLVVREMSWYLFLPDGYDYRGFSGMEMIQKKPKKADQQELKELVAAFSMPLLAPNFLRFQARAKQSEPKQDLGAIFTAQTSYFSEHNTYGRTFADIGWEPKGAIRYSYYLGKDVIAPPTNAYPAQGLFTGTRVDANSFQVIAIGNVDNDNVPDIWMIDQEKKLVNLVDDVKLGEFTDEAEAALQELKKSGLIADVDALKRLTPVSAAIYATGILPIKLDIPQQGKIYEFKKLFPEEGAGKKTPSVSFWYFPIKMARGAKGFTWLTLAGMLVIGIGAAVGYARRHPDGSQKVARGAGKTVKYIFLGWIALQFAGCGVMMLFGLFH